MGALSAPTGALVARALAGSWRATPPTCDLTEEEVASIIPQLMASGAPALCWRMVRGTPISDTETGHRLADAHRMHALNSTMNERRVAAIVGAMADARIDHVLIKGWDAARKYPEKGLRPYGDIDICVRGTDIGRARSVLDALEEGVHADLGARYEVDDVEATLSRARVAMLGDLHVKVPSEEDRLAILALHTMKHGVWRPLWLCDVGLAAGAPRPTFDWNLCLGPRDGLRANHILAALGLARELLGADLNALPGGVAPPPRWLVRHTLREWSRPWPRRHGVIMDPIIPIWRPVRFSRDLWERRPDPAKATVAMGARFDDSPRLPLQVRWAWRRTVDKLRGGRPFA